MLQNLLIERFRLHAHIESREFPAYALEIAKSGPKLKPAVHPANPVPAAWRQDGFPDVPTDRPAATASHRMMAGGYTLTRIKVQQQPVLRLAKMLRFSAGQPVVDRTSIEGDFDFTLEFSVASTNTSADSTAEPAGASDLKIALHEQLGLELVKRRIAFPVVVIDAVDRLPTEN